MRRQLLYILLSLVGLFIFSPFVAFAHGDEYWLIFLWLLLFPWLIVKTIALWEIFKIASEDAWKAIVPVYNIYIQFKLAGYKKWFRCVLIIWFIGLFILNYSYIWGRIMLLISRVMRLIVLFNFARKFGWKIFPSILFAAFYPICILILWFGNFKYEGKSETDVEA